MGETSVYIVLSNNATEYRDAYEQFLGNPGCRFGGCGVVLGDDGLIPLPNEPYDAICPYCGENNYDVIVAKIESEIYGSGITEKFSVECDKCRKTYGLSDINSGRANWYLAENYIYISDINPDEWDSGDISNAIKNSLPGVIDVVTGWMT
jgi:hypothetical protein